MGKWTDIKPGWLLKDITKLRGWITKLDINNAFLHGHLNEEVYMVPPQGYYKAQPGQHTDIVFVILLVYVDDVILTGNSVDAINKCKMALHSKFTIKDLGPMKYFLGLEVARSSHATIISQTKFICDVLKDVGMLQCKPASSPLPQGLHLTPDSGEPLSEPDMYRRLLGRLLYINLTRPDICYAVQHLSQFMNKPRKPHWEAALHVLRYLKGSLHQGLYFPVTDDLSLSAYCDSDWAACTYSCKSLSGTCRYSLNCPYLYIVTVKQPCTLLPIQYSMSAH
ncbi:uncharacterized mitochondrial protein AtMg00810-like [Manihot esculenta]|uniref:uncharacterized mitochondrial protein AtMg00810-like n=1 Tax=Manihot esculenta TaxID=3983 RepID=UPI001CC69AD2|nr:uncharacterized mitochondrial protein AtMg00810-like [Manihot esculenta]